MRARVFLLSLIILAAFKSASGQWLQLPAYPERMPGKDTALFRKKEPLRPVFAAVKYDYYKHLGVACKLEFKFERSTSVPLRLRLGSLQQTDYMEQKPNAVKPER